MISKNKVVQFHYQLADGTGKQIETSRGSEPMAYLHGHNNVIVGLEEQLAGKEVGDVFTAVVGPEKGYGKRDEDQQQRIPVKHLQGAKKWKPGMIAMVDTDKGQRQVTILKMGKFMVTVDSNHPLAGHTLTFDIEVMDIRDATAEEISHKHAHGAGGHQH